MIPVRLELENFLSYGKRQTIDFSSYPLICLSGKNGHGKSALLDAMTWAIWGQARKVSGTAKPDANLLRIGQTFMTVTFEFTFNNSQYRIKREYAKTYAKPYASLDFGIIDPETKKTRPLTDKTIRKTQLKIEQTIGLDYDTFINTAFLRQGASNEFSKKSAKERKQILSTILGLAQYEQLKKRALDKAKDLGTQKKYMVDHHVKVTEQLKKTDEIKAAITTIKKKLLTLSASMKNREVNRQKLVIDKQKLAAHIEQRNGLTAQLEQLTKEQEHQQKALRTIWHEWRSVNRTQRSVNNKETLAAKKQLLAKTVQTHQKTFEQQLHLKEQLLQIKEQHVKVAQTLQAQLETERQQQQLNLAHQEMLTKQVATKLEKNKHEQELTTKQIARTLKQMTELQAQMGTVEKTIIQQEKQRPQFEKRKDSYHHWVALWQQLTKEQTDLTQKKQLSIDQENPSCPLCEQNLSAARKRFIQSKLLKREQFVSHRLKRLKTIITLLKQILIAQHAKLEEVQKLKQNMERQRVQLTHLHKEHNTLLAQQRDYEKSHTSLTKEVSAIGSALQKSKTKLKELDAAHKKLLNEHTEYQKLAQQLQTLEKSYKELNYNAQQHKTALQQLSKIETQLQAYEKLAEQLAHQAQRKQSILVHLATLRAHKKQCRLLTSNIEKLKIIDVQKKKLEIQEKEVLNALHTLQKEKEILSREQGSLEHEHKQLQELAKQLTIEQKQLKSLENGSFDYATIATALGKDGIQALLIEEAIPEIEHEANALLGQLTDNQAHIMIESLRDLKKGGTKETLDINISDSQGIRPYELFSGGEAFRIDFALRIAISKLLARRAGTSLQTLIIDEGFGSQDDEGLQRLMECIYAIQDNFCKIIIVSHLQSLKEQFPVHFAVDKGPQGSQVHVIEQG